MVYSQTNFPGRIIVALQGIGKTAMGIDKINAKGLLRLHQQSLASYFNINGGEKLPGC